MRFLVTGCGRSGTNYVADRLCQSGVKCGHESVYSVEGPLGVRADEYQGDSSWFAAPFLNDANGIKVFHIVREPRSVIESFHRIGLCADSKLRHFSGGKGLFSTILRFNFNLKKSRRRLNYVNAHRKLLADHTTCWDNSDEFYRLCEYWVQWNTMIETNAALANLPYLRLRLDQVDDSWPAIEDFLELSCRVTPGRATNKKMGYRPVDRFQKSLPEKVVELARIYGFNASS